MTKHLITIASFTAALIWTGLLLFLTLSNSDGAPVQTASSLLGGTDLTDAVGHMILLFGLAAWWFISVKRVKSRRFAWRYAVGLALIVGLGTETAQIWIPSRGAGLLDYGANTLGVWLFTQVHQRKSRGA